MDKPIQANFVMGLRFRKSQARFLFNLAERARSGELGTAAVGLFKDAANAARNGEPLLVMCDRPEEAVAMADGFAMYGVVRPTVEVLSGSGGG